MDARPASFAEKVDEQSEVRRERLGGGVEECLVQLHRSDEYVVPLAVAVGIEPGGSKLLVLVSRRVERGVDQPSPSASCTCS